MSTYKGNQRQNIRNAHVSVYLYLPTNVSIKMMRIQCTTDQATVKT